MEVLLGFRGHHTELGLGCHCATGNPKLLAAYLKCINLGIRRTRHLAQTPQIGHTKRVTIMPDRFTADRSSEHDSASNR